MRQLKTTLTVLGAVALLAIGGNGVALATTGHGLVLGKANSAGSVTTLKRTTSGPALDVVTRKTSNPPFATNARGKVVHLNADLLDGLDGATLRTATWVYQVPGATGVAEFTDSLPRLPRGIYLATYDVGASVSSTNGAVNCELERNFDDDELLGYGVLPPGRTFSEVSDSGVVDTRTGAPLMFRCFTFNGTLTMTPPDGHVSFTRIDTLASAAAIDVP
ncbi:MAG: hypothetical protein ACJ72E_00575 [Marmoricola sp.]